MAEQPVAADTRRARVRTATTAEIKTTARRLLVEEGPDALTLRAIARSMGMTAPALYRYFSSHEELVGACTRTCSPRSPAPSSGPGTPWDRRTRSAA